MIRAIVADDEPAVASIIRHFIETGGLPVNIVGVAENGGQALEMIRAMRPDVVFIDIQMPIHTGLEVMRQFSETKYVIVTAYESFNYAREALRLGAYDILLKPIDSRQLSEAITRCVGCRFTANPLTNQVMQYIHNHYAERIDLPRLAEAIHASTSHMARTFKKHAGLSIHSYLNKVRIDKAKTMLADKELSIQKIAAGLGYESLNNFYKYFKAATGTTPAVFRRQAAR